MAATDVQAQSPQDVAARLGELADFVVPLALRAICDLNVADLLCDGPRSVEQLARATGAHAASLQRVLRALASREIFVERPAGTFGLTPMSEFLRSDNALSLRDGYPLMAADLVAWGHLGYALRTGGCAFEHVHGRTYYDHLAADDELRVRFDRSVDAQNRIMLRALVPAYDWSGCGTIVDVAGGTGAFLAGLLKHHRALRGVLFDLPHVVRDAPPVLARAGVAERCRIEPGSFFETLPGGEDTYLLKTVLHDWDDEHAQRILSGVVAAMGPDSRVLVLEALLPAGDAFHMGKLLDVNSMVLVAGPDRGEEQLVALLAGAGLVTRRVIGTSTLALLEAQRA